MRINYLIFDADGLRKIVYRIANAIEEEYEAAREISGNVATSSSVAEVIP